MNEDGETEQAVKMANEIDLLDIPGLVDFKPFLKWYSNTLKYIIVYGGASFDSSLIKENLIDEYYLFINPVAIGNGKTIFKDLKEIHKLSIVE